jgi:hypothetical protein
VSFTPSGIGITLVTFTGIVLIVAGALSVLYAAARYALERSGVQPDFIAISGALDVRVAIGGTLAALGGRIAFGWPLWTVIAAPLLSLIVSFAIKPLVRVLIHRK